MSVEQKVIEIYEDAGYAPEEITKSLLGIVGAAIIYAKKDTAQYIADNFEVDIKVFDKGVKHDG